MKEQQMHFEAHELAESAKNDSQKLLYLCASDKEARLVRHELDLERMNAACQMLINHKNFKCFSKTITGISSFKCDITEAQWSKTPEGYRFTIKANRFLRNMVRAVVGTMVEIGTHKIDLKEFQQILDSQERSRAGQSVPPQGLFLVKVDYENDKNCIA